MRKLWEEIFVKVEEVQKLYELIKEEKDAERRRELIEKFKKLVRNVEIEAGGRND